MKRYGLAATGAVMVFTALGVADVGAQEQAVWWQDPLRPSGQPVIPIFEGWYENEDGTYSLCFGYQNLNTEETLYLPLGENNFIEPDTYHGGQPTQFDPPPQPLSTSTRRQFCAFSVIVPEDIGDRRVWWTLRRPPSVNLPLGGQEFSVPGHVTASAYMLDEVQADPRGDMATQFQEFTTAPVIKLDPEGSVLQGRSSGLLSGQDQGTPRIAATVGEAIPVTVWVGRADLAEDDRPVRLWWFQHQGPRAEAATFTQRRFEVAMEGAAGLREVSTTVEFSEPGEYVLRVVAYNSTGEFVAQCCWTNGFVRVRVTN